MAKGKFKISILTPSEDISALKLRGWLYAEAEQINNTMTGEYDYAFIRLFIQNRVRFAFTKKKIDALMQGVTEKFENIFQVELFVVDKPLSFEQIQEEHTRANIELSEMVKIATGTSKSDNLYPEEEGLIQFFGYSTEASKNESPFDLPEEGLVCMVSNITEYNREAISKETGRTFELDQWFVSESEHESTIVHGPFDSENVAFDFGKEHCMAIRFKAAPVFEMI